MIRDATQYSPTWDAAIQMATALKGESDRGLALICATMLDDLLKQCLEAHLVDHKDVKKLTEGFGAPVGPFHARILVSFAVGLVSEDEYNDLSLIRRIRNEFAHSINASFGMPKIVSHCESFINIKTPAQPRARFTLSATLMAMLLEGRAVEASGQRLFHREWKAFISEPPAHS